MDTKLYHIDTRCVKSDFERIVQIYNNHNNYYWDNEKIISKIHNNPPFSKTSIKYINIGSRKSAFTKCKID